MTHLYMNQNINEDIESSTTTLVSNKSDLTLEQISLYMEILKEPFYMGLRSFRSMSLDPRSLYSTIEYNVIFETFPCIIRKVADNSIYDEQEHLTQNQISNILELGVFSIEYITKIRSIEGLSSFCELKRQYDLNEKCEHIVS
jgi:hypothetical protein